MVRPLLGLVRLLLSQDREGLTILNVFSFCKTFSFHTLILHHGSVIEFLQFKTFFKMKTEPQWWSRKPLSYRQYEKVDILWSRRHKGIRWSELKTKEALAMWLTCSKRRHAASILIRIQFVKWRRFLFISKDKGHKENWICQRLISLIFTFCD